MPSRVPRAYAWKRSYMSAQPRGVLSLGAESPPLRIEPRSASRMSLSGASALRSACIIWPTFSSRVMRASRASTSIGPPGVAAGVESVPSWPQCVNNSTHANARHPRVPLMLALSNIAPPLPSWSLAPTNTPHNGDSPRVEASCRVSRERTGRAIAGLPMGGMESLLVGLGNPSLFAWIGASSAGGTDDDFARQFGAEKRTLRPRLLWISCGKDDRLFGVHRRLVEWLPTVRIQPTWAERPGAHTFLVWRRCLAELAPLLFTD